VYYTAIAVLRSAQNNIEIGLTPLTLDRADFIDEEKLVSYNCRSGMVKDTKLSESFNTTCWRQGGEPAPINTPFQLKITLDMSEQYVEWYIDDAIVASAKLPSMFMQGFKIIFGLFNTEDSVLLNEEDWKGRLRLGKFDKSSFIIEPRQNLERSGKIRRTLMIPSVTDYLC
jgi:hypothetical protein